MKRFSALSASLAALTLGASACSSESSSSSVASVQQASVSAADTEASAAPSEASRGETSGAQAASSSGESTFTIEVWADNWMAVYVNGELIGEDSVPITTERSFNAETFTFDASYPFTLAIEARDFKETDSGIEYIGQQKQQMGDGGIIAQVTDLSTGAVVASTDSSWQALVIHRAPLNTECVHDSDPDATCEFEILEAPSGWTSESFDAGEFSPATEWSADAVGPKDGYNEIDWDSSAQLIWGTDLEVDNTILLRTTVEGR